MADQVAEEVKRFRSRELHGLADRMKVATLARHVGREYEILWERCNQTGAWTGYTPHFHRVSMISDKDMSGKIVRQTIHTLDSLSGSLLAKSPLKL